MTFTVPHLLIVALGVVAAGALAYAGQAAAKGVMRLASRIADGTREHIEAVRINTEATQELTDAVATFSTSVDRRFDDHARRLDRHAQRLHHLDGLEDNA